MIYHVETLSGDIIFGPPCTLTVTDTSSSFKIKVVKITAITYRILMAVITVDPADKTSFVYSCMQTRLMGQYNGNRPISLVCVSKPLITVVTAIADQLCSSVVHRECSYLFSRPQIITV